MINFYNKDYIVKTRKAMKYKFLWLSFFVFLIALTLILTFVFQRRETAIYFKIISPIIIFLSATSVLYIIFTYVTPFKSILNIYKHVEEKKTSLVKGVVKEIDEKEFTYKHIRCKKLTVLCEDEKIKSFFIPVEFFNDFNLNETYNFSHLFVLIVGYEHEDI